MAWFDARTVEPSTGAASWPLGKHPVVITAGHRKSVKDKPNAGLLEFTLTVIDGPSRGFEGPYRLNLWNDNAQAAEIAGKQLSAICHVVNTYVIETENGAELFNKPFVVNVTPQKNDERYTEISGVYDMNGQPPARQAAPGLNQQQAAAAPATPAASQGAPVASTPSWTQQATPAASQGAPVASTPSWAQQPAGGASGAPPWGSR